MSTDRGPFHYSLTEGWKSINDPMPLSEGRTYAQTLVLAGYGVSISIGDENAVNVSLYRGEGDNSPYPYLIDFSDGFVDWEVYLSDFPSVVELMNKFATICQATIVSDVYIETEATRMDEAEKSIELQKERRRRAREQQRRDTGFRPELVP